MVSGAMTGKVLYLQRGEDGQILCTYHVLSSVHNVGMEGVQMTQKVLALHLSQTWKSLKSAVFVVCVSCDLSVFA